MSSNTTQAATNGAGRQPVLSVRGLHTAVSTPEGSFDVVRDVSFDINPNEVLCLVGESGCGKTITALSIMRLLPTPPVRITSGEIVFDNSDLTQLPQRRVRAVRSERISMIFQDPLTSLDPVFTVGQVMTEVIRAHRDVTRAQARAMSHRDPPGRRAARPRGAFRRLSPPAVGRDAPAGDDRHRAGAGSRDPHRGRAHHRARRDRAGPDPGAAAPGAAGPQHVDAADHPRPGRGGLDSRPGGGDVRGERSWRRPQSTSCSPIRAIPTPRACCGPCPA